MRLSATNPPTTSVVVDGKVQLAITPGASKVRIDRIIEKDGSDEIKVLEGVEVNNYKQALPPAVPAGWHHIGLVIILPWMNRIDNRQITESDSWQELDVQSFAGAHSETTIKVEAKPEWRVLAVLSQVEGASYDTMQAWAALFRALNSDNALRPVVQMLDKESGALVLYQS